MAPAFPPRSQAIMANLVQNGVLIATPENLQDWSGRLTQQNMADYASTISAISIALDGNKTDLAPMGYLFAPDNMDVILPFNIFPHPENSEVIALHIYRPAGKDISEGIKTLAAMVRDADVAEPGDERLDFILRRFRHEQIAIIRDELGHIDNEPWFGSAPYEDDTLENVVFDAQKLVRDIDTPQFRTVRLVRNRFRNQLERRPGEIELVWEDYQQSKHEDAARAVIDEFFKFDDEKKRRISDPEHYYNLLGENLRSDEHFIRQIGMINGQAVAWIVLERIDDSDVWAMPVNMALHHQFRGLSEETVFRAASLIEKLGDQWIDMGGSENLELFNFKRKFQGKPPITPREGLQGPYPSWKRLEI